MNVGESGSPTQVDIVLGGTISLAPGYGVYALDLLDDSGSQTWVQGATLAGLVKNPSAYDPLRNADHGLQRRNVVLDRLAQLHVIGQHKADKFKKKGN